MSPAWGALLGLALALLSLALLPLTSALPLGGIRRIAAGGLLLVVRIARGPLALLVGVARPTFAVVLRTTLALALSVGVPDGRCCLLHLLVVATGAGLAILRGLVGIELPIARGVGPFAGLRVVGLVRVAGPRWALAASGLPPGWPAGFWGWSGFWPCPCPRPDPCPWPFSNGFRSVDGFWPCPWPSGVPFGFWRPCSG